MSSAVGSSNQSLALGRNKNRKRKRKTPTAPNRRCSTSKTFLGYLFLLDERSNIASLGPEPPQPQVQQRRHVLRVDALRDAVTVVTSSSRRDVNSLS